MTPDLRMQAGPHVFVDDLDQPTLGDADRHHLERSLRLRAADPLTLSDAAGGWRTAAFGDVIEPTGPRHEVHAPVYKVGLGVASSGLYALMLPKSPVSATIRVHCLS